MIIPPDPEKDPRLFAESTTSLVSVSDPHRVSLDSRENELTSLGLDGPTPPRAAYRPHEPYPFGDEYGYETLPPYESPRLTRERGAAGEGARQGAAGVGFGVGMGTHAGVDGTLRPLNQQRSFRESVLARSPSQASTSSGSSGSASFASTGASRRFLRGRPQLRSGPSGSHSRTSATATAVDSDRHTSATGKHWEGLVFPREPRRRWHGIPLPPRVSIPVSPEVREYWAKHKRWITALLVFLGLAIALGIGLGVGFTAAMARKPTSRKSGSPWHGKKSNQAYEPPDLNMTYTPGRDGPRPEDGMASNCNEWKPLSPNCSLSQLAVNSPYFEHFITTFTFPLQDTDKDNVLALPDQLYFIARGLAASGTVEFVGSNAPYDVISGGTEGAVRIDVLARSPQGQSLKDTTNVCQMRRQDGSAGVGIYTPIETDGGADGPFLLNPLKTPAFHVIVRLPPSIVNATNNTDDMDGTDKTVYLSNVSLELSQMGTRFGQLQNISQFGDLDLRADCRGGGVVVDYLTAANARISGAEGTVQGTFNISGSLSINSTSGTIFANVVLWDPDNNNDTSSTISSGIPMPKRSLSGLGSVSKAMAVPDSSTSTKMWVNKHPPHHPAKVEFVESHLKSPSHAVNTSFLTNEGFIFVAYLHHPPSTALKTFVASQSGMVDIAMHPNYIGAFSLFNLWGSIRLPPVSPLFGQDPEHLGRKRVVIQGDIDLSDDPDAEFFIQHNVTTVGASEVTGAAWWALFPEMNDRTTVDVQNSVEASGSGLVAVANLGDLQVTFDGT